MVTMKRLFKYFSSLSFPSPQQSFNKVKKQPAVSDCIRLTKMHYKQCRLEIVVSIHSSQVTLYSIKLTRLVKRDNIASSSMGGIDNFLLFH